MPVTLFATIASDTITSAGDEMITAAPDGVVVEGWLFSVDVASRGTAVSIPENSQITTAPLDTVALGVIVMEVAPGVLFFEYQTSTIEPLFVSMDRAGPASV
jgi:hypothetical protein